MGIEEFGKDSRSSSLRGSKVESSEQGVPDFFGIGEIANVNLNVWHARLLQKVSSQRVSFAIAVSRRFCRRTICHRWLLLVSLTI